MKIIIIGLGLLFSIGYSNYSHSAEGVEVRDMSEMLAQINMEKKQMEIIVDKLVETGRITQENGVRAKREIASIKAEDTENLKMELVSLISSVTNN